MWNDKVVETDEEIRKRKAQESIERNLLETALFRSHDAEIGTRSAINALQRIVVQTDLPSCRYSELMQHLTEAHGMVEMVIATLKKEVA